MDKLTGMRVFTQIATMRSFKKAGERLGMAPSVISKHLSAFTVSLALSKLQEFFWDKGKEGDRQQAVA